VAELRTHLSWSLHLGFHVMLVLVALTGLLLSFVPDVLPGFATRPRRLLGPDAGLARLDEFHDRNKEGTEAAALARGVTLAEVIAEEWNLPLPCGPTLRPAQRGAQDANSEVPAICIRRRGPACPC